MLVFSAGTLKCLASSFPGAVAAYGWFMLLVNVLPQISLSGSAVFVIEGTGGKAIGVMLNK
jgi:hypothetical protein